MEIKVLKNIFGANEEKANEIRQLLTDKKVFMANLIGSPGSGKTTFLEKVMQEMGSRYKIAIIEGDVATDRDARRLQKFNRPITLINTDGACHLEALSIEKALKGFNLDELDFIFVENVGNMVCPAEFDIGEHAKIAISSTPEGDDKPAKYPLLFTEAKAVILSKTDLMPYINFNKEAYVEDLQKINARIPIFEISNTNEQGLTEVFAWLEEQIT